MAATKPSFANPEIKRDLDPLDAPGTKTCKKGEDHQANSYVVSEFLHSYCTSSNQQQQMQQIVMVEMQRQ